MSNPYVINGGSLPEPVEWVTVQFAHNSTTVQVRH